MSRKPSSRRKRGGRAKAPGRTRPLKLVGRILAALALVVLLAGGWAAWTYRGPGPAAPSGASTTVMLARGSGVTQIAHALKKAGVIGSTRIFLLAAKFSGAARSLKAGEYEFPSHASMARILADIHAGKVVRHHVTIPEGWTSAMVADAVQREPVLAGMRWHIPGELAFYGRGRPEAYSLGLALEDRHSQYDLWRPNPTADASIGSAISCPAETPARAETRLPPRIEKADWVSSSAMVPFW